MELYTRREVGVHKMAPIRNRRNKYWQATVWPRGIGANINVDWLKDAPEIQWGYGQFEKAPSTERIHWQGYIVFKTERTLSGVKRICGDGHHFEIRKGTHEQLKEYCSKDDTRLPGYSLIEWGQEPSSNQGQRSDLLEVQAALDDGLPMSYIAQEYFVPFCRYYKAFKEYSVLVSQKQRKQRDWITHTTVYWGPPGTGKTRRALHEAGPDAFWLPKPNCGTVWWDGYDGQKTVVIDEFWNGWIPRDMLQRICDRYPLNVPTRSGVVPFVAERIIITSNQPPSMWYPKIGLGPMERRLSGECGTVVVMEDAWEPSEGSETLPIVIASEEEVGFSPIAGQGMGLSEDELPDSVEGLTCLVPETPPDGGQLLRTYARLGEHARQGLLPRPHYIPPGGRPNSPIPWLSE